MASFHSKTFQIHDDYMTPKYAWENIKEYLPKDKLLWECFYGNGTSGNHLKELGFNVIHDNLDFFENDLGDIIVSNPPFSNIPVILERLMQLDKPFVLIMPSSKINTQYFRKTFSNNENRIQIIIPRKRIQFDKILNGVSVSNQKNICNFDCFYYCWKMNLPRDIIWLE
jgi:hypothetical protein